MSSGLASGTSVSVVDASEELLAGPMKLTLRQNLVGLDNMNVDLENLNSEYLLTGSVNPQVEVDPLPSGGKDVEVGFWVEWNVS